MGATAKLERTYIQTTVQVSWITQSVSAEYEIYNYADNLRKAGVLILWEFSRQDISSESSIKLKFAAQHGRKAPEVLLEIYRLIEENQ